jgi:hypothetical protein
MMNPSRLWVAAALVLCLFAAMLFRPERVTRPVLFHLACWLLAGAVLAQDAAILILGVPIGMTNTSQVAWGQIGVMQAVTYFQPLLLPASFLAAVYAVIPGPGPTKPPGER